MREEMTREEAINALMTESCVDCSSGFSAYECCDGGCPLREAVYMAIEALKQPEPNTGKWIGGELGYCSVCGHEGCASDIWTRCHGMFCPNCGAKLEE